MNKISSFQRKGVSTINKKRLNKVISIVSTTLIFINSIFLVKAKQLEIQNSAPVATISADVLHQKKIDLNFVTDITSSNATMINNKLTQFVSDEDSKGIDVRFNVIDGTKLTKINGYNVIDTSLVKNFTLRSEAEHIFVEASDGTGISYVFGSLNLQFANYIANNNFSVYCLTPISNANYKMAYTSQDTTIQQLINCSPIEGKIYDSTSTGALAQLDNLINDLKDKYNNNTEPLIPSSSTSKKNADVQVLTDYQNNTISLNNLVNKMGNIGPTLFPYNVNFNFNSGTDLMNTLVNTFNPVQMLACSSSNDITILTDNGRVYSRFTNRMTQNMELPYIKQIGASGGFMYALSQDGYIYKKLFSNYTQNQVFKKVTTFPLMQKISDTGSLLLGINGIVYNDMGQTVFTPPSAVKSLSGSCVLLENGELYSNGYVPTGATTSYGFEGKAGGVFNRILQNETIEQVYSDGYCTYAVTSDNRVLAAGRNNIGSLGTGDKLDANSFKQVFSGKDIKKISIYSDDSYSKYSSALILTTDGYIYRAGYINSTTTNLIFSQDGNYSNVDTACLRSTYVESISKDKTKWTSPYPLADNMLINNYGATSFIGKDRKVYGYAGTQPDSHYGTPFTNIVRIVGGEDGSPFYGDKDGYAYTSRNIKSSSPINMIGGDNSMVIGNDQVYNASNWTPIAGSQGAVQVMSCDKLYVLLGNGNVLYNSTTGANRVDTLLTGVPAIKWMQKNINYVGGNYGNYFVATNGNIYESGSYGGLHLAYSGTDTVSFDASHTLDSNQYLSYNYAGLVTSDGSYYEGADISDSMVKVSGLPKIKKVKLIDRPQQVYPNVIGAVIVYLLAEDGSVYAKIESSYPQQECLVAGKYFTNVFEKVPGLSNVANITRDFITTEDGEVYITHDKDELWFDPYYNGGSNDDAPWNYYWYTIRRIYSNQSNTYLDNSLFRNFANDGVDHYVLYVGDGTTLQKVKSTYKQMLIDSGTEFIAVCPNSTFSNSVGCDTIQGLANATNGRVFTTVDDAVNYIINKYTNLSDSRLPGYIVENEDVLIYNKTYDDRERDSNNKNTQYSERWRYNQDSKYFENDQGVIDSNNTWSAPSITATVKKIFNKVGSYLISYQTQDNPALNNTSVNGTIPDESKFENYRQFSLGENQINVYVNRRPIAQFSYTQNGTSLSVTNTSFDLDHMSFINKGTKEVLYKYKKIDDIDWQSSTSPPSTLQSGAIYILSLQVKDFDGFVSRPYTQILGVAGNMPPVASFSLDSNTMISGTVNNINVHDYDPENDPLVNPKWWVTDSLGIPIKDYSLGVLIDDYYATKPDLSKLSPGNYFIKHNTMDDPSLRGAGLTALTSNIAVQSLTVNKMLQPPTVTLEYAPSFIYEGDKVTLKMVPTSPIGDNLHLTLEESTDAGANWTLVYNNISASSGVPINFTKDSIAIGNYQYRATVIDNFGLMGTAKVQFPVNPLGITGYVNHTDLWNKHRQEYNVSKTGNAETPRAYNTFFQGEKFMLHADTTLIDPASSVTAKNVHVQIENYSFNTDLSNTSDNHWDGSLWDISMMKWPPQDVNFIFTVTYSNGTVKINTVTIKVDNEHYWQLHRKF